MTILWNYLIHLNGIQSISFDDTPEIRPSGRSSINHIIALWKTQAGMTAEQLLDQKESHSRAIQNDLELLAERKVQREREKKEAEADKALLQASLDAEAIKEQAVKDDGISFFFSNSFPHSFLSTPGFASCVYPYQRLSCQAH